MINDMRFGDAAFKFKGRAGPLYPTYALCWILSAVLLIGSIIFFSYEFATWFGNELSAIYDRIFNNTSPTDPTQSEYYAIGIIFMFIFGIIVFFAIIIPMLWAVYTAKEIRTFANYTRFDGAQFKLNATAPSMIWLAVSNLLLTIFTLGIARPFVIQRGIRYLITRLTLQGAIDIARIQQSVAAMPKRGEGLADAFDLGAW